MGHMESSIVGAKGQVVIPQKIRAMLHIKTGTRVHFEARRGEIVLTLRLAPRPSLAFARDRLAVGSLRIPPHGQSPWGSTPITPRYVEQMAGCLGTGGKALKDLLEEKTKEQAR